MNFSVVFLVKKELVNGIQTRSQASGHVLSEPHLSTLHYHTDFKEED